MKRWNAHHLLATALFGVILPVISAKADSIAMTYNLTGIGTVQSSTDTTLTLVAQASGSVVSSDTALNAAWNPITYSDQSILDLTTGLLNGNFTILLQDGDTLLGNVFEDDSVVDASLTQTGPFPQTLTFTGGTGAFAGVTGSVSGNGFLGPTSFTVSGSGTLETPVVPEPAPAILLVPGLALMMAGASRSLPSIRPNFRLLTCRRTMPAKALGKGPFEATS